MFLIQEVLVSTEVLQRKFVCALDACKGACCWKGDYGAPLDKEEHQKIQEILPEVEQVLPKSNKKRLKEVGYYYYEKENGKDSVSMFEDGTCTFLIEGENGIGTCAFEKAYNDGLTDFKKPISCHLYPLRIEKNEETGFEGINYDEWEICKAACKLGNKMNLPVYKFVQEALIRKYGQSFYDELEAAAIFLEKVE